MTDKLKSEINSNLTPLVETMNEDEHRPILLTLGGSYAYGTNVESSDIDIRGIYLNNKSELLGTVPDKEQYQPSDSDTTIYSLRKAISLIKDCNPGMLEMLGCRKEDYIQLAPEGQLIIDNLSIFLSKKATKTFGGYAKSQLNRLINRSGRAKDLLLDNEERSFAKAFLSLRSRYSEYIDKSAYIKQSDGQLFLSFSVADMPVDSVASLLNEFNSIDRSYRKSTRNDKAAAHGKLAKHMMHLVRLYMMGIEVLTDQTVTTYRSKEHDLLMSIRAGKYLAEDGVTPTKEFEDLVEYYSSEYEKSAETTQLPDEPDYDAINKLVITINEMNM